MKERKWILSTLVLNNVKLQIERVEKQRDNVKSDKNIKYFIGPKISILFTDPIAMTAMKE